MARRSATWGTALGGTASASIARGSARVGDTAVIGRTVPVRKWAVAVWAPMNTERSWEEASGIRRAGHALPLPRRFVALFQLQPRQRHRGVLGELEDLVQAGKHHHRP